MALSRTTSRLFSKAPTYTRQTQNEGVRFASGYGAGSEYINRKMIPDPAAPLMPQAPPVPIPAPFVGPATPWGLSEQRNAVGPDGRPTPYPDRLKAYYNYARPFVNPGNGVNMADAMQMNVRGTYPTGQDLFDMPWSPPDTQGPVLGVSPQNPMQPTQTGPSAVPHNFMQSPVNMSGFQNKPMAPTMGVAGLMPGFAGAASQGYLAAIGKGYSAAQSLNQQNPMQIPALIGGRSMPAGGNPVEWARAQAEIARRDAPQGSRGPVGMPPGLNPAQIAQWNQSQAEIANRDRFQPVDNQQYAARWQGPVQPGSLDLWASQMSGIDPNRVNEIPAPQNSLQAGANAQGSPMNQSTAAMSNGYYSPPSSVNQGREYGLTLPMDLAGQQNRIANQNPMYAGMQSRFGAGSVMGQQAATIAQNEGAGNIRIPGSYGEMPTYVQKGESPEVRFRSNANGDQVSFNSNNDPVLKRQQAALRNFTPNAERGANRKAAREATKARLADSRFKMQVSKGLNPNSAKAKAMFPEQVAKMQGMSPNNPMAQAGPPGSLEDMQLASDTVVGNLSGANPHFNLIGATPESTLSDISSGITAHIAGGGALSDDSLKSFQEHARALSRLKTDKDPFDFNTGVMGSGSKEREGRLWRDLASLPDTPEARRDWLSRYKSRDAQTSRPEDPNSQEAIDRKRAEDSLRRYPPRAGA